MTGEDATDGIARRDDHDPVALVTEVARAAGVDAWVVERAEAAVWAYVETGRHQGRHPRGVAAGGIAAVLDAHGEGADYMGLQEPAGVSHPTIRKRADEIQPFVGGE